jgi:hypothetical protein
MVTLGYRGQRGLPKWLRFLPIALVNALAKRRRRLGWYDKRTLALFRYCWLQKRSTDTLLAYILFRCDLGWSLTPRFTQLLTQALPDLSPQQRALTINLLADTHAPALSQQKKSIKTTILTMQSLWRTEFKQWLQQHSAGGISVVGNSGRLLGQGIGQLIDAQAIVVRFNRFQSLQSLQSDIGERLNIWVTAPNCDSDVPEHISWVIMTGSVAFKLQNWTRFEHPLMRGCKVLTVPLEHWRELVKQLQAPPSAGILFLTWLYALLGSWQFIKAVGFGYSAQTATHYHHAKVKHSAASRHHWVAELALLKRWQQQGLSVDLPA